MQFGNTTATSSDDGSKQYSRKNSEWLLGSLSINAIDTSIFTTKHYGSFPYYDAINHVKEILMKNWYEWFAIINKINVTDIYWESLYCEFPTYVVDFWE